MESGTLTPKQVKIYKELMKLPVAQLVARALRHVGADDDQGRALTQAIDSAAQLVQYATAHWSESRLVHLQDLSCLKLSAQIWGDWCRTLPATQYIAVSLWVASKKTIIDVAEKGVDVFTMAELASMCDIIDANGESGIYAEACVTGMGIVLSEATRHPRFDEDPSAVISTLLGGQ